METLSSNHWTTGNAQNVIFIVSILTILLSYIQTFFSTHGGILRAVADGDLEMVKFVY